VESVQAVPEEQVSSGTLIHSSHGDLQSNFYSNR
jgi:hypothetical protein